MLRLYRIILDFLLFALKLDQTLKPQKWLVHLRNQQVHSLGSTDVSCMVASALVKIITTVITIVIVTITIAKFYIVYCASSLTYVHDMSFLNTVNTYQG